MKRRATDRHGNVVHNVKVCKRGLRGGWRAKDFKTGRKARNSE